LGGRKKKAVDRPGHRKRKRERTYSEVGKLEPENEKALECKVPGHVIQYNRESNALKEVEETKYNPVSQPLNVVSVAGALKSLEGKVGGETEPNEVGDGCGEGVEKVKEKEKRGATEDNVGFWDLGALLEVDEDGILGELEESCDKHLGNRCRQCTSEKESRLTSLSSWEL
jgi:hypothetical protein